MTRIRIRMAELPEIKELITIDAAGILSIDEVGIDASESYMNGEMNESEFRKWMRIFTEIEETGLHSLEKVGKDLFSGYIKGELKRSEADKLIHILGELSEKENNEKEEFYD